MWKLLSTFLFLSVTLNADGLVYKAVGDTVVLTAVSQEKHITSIQWKQVPDIAAEWSGGLTTYYSHFKGRSALDVSTGALTITGLTADHSGTYTAEINYNIANSLELLVISSVSKPNISTWCDPEMTFCELTCEGDTTGAKPVTFSWRLPGGFVNSTKVLTITMDKTETSYSCIVENPVSREESAAITDPFPQKRIRMWILLCIILLAVVIGIVIVIARVLIFKFKSRKGWTLVHQKQPNQETADQETADQETADQETADQETADQETADQETADPETADQETADPETADQETADQETADPETADQETADQETADQETADPETADPETADPETADPETADPETADPETADPETAGPETADPETADPETAGPETAGPETADPETAGPETAGPETAGPETAVSWKGKLFWKTAAPSH